MSNEAFFKKVNHFPLSSISPQLKCLTLEQWVYTPYTALNLSNTEIQVLNLLRLLFSKKEVVIFDEAFSKLNEEASKCFVDFVKKYLKAHHMIGIVVTHFTDTIRGANYMYRIENAQVVSEGKPEFVMNIRRNKE